MAKRNEAAVIRELGLNLDAAQRRIRELEGAAAEAARAAQAAKADAAVSAAAREKRIKERPFSEEERKIWLGLVHRMAQMPSRMRMVGPGGYASVDSNIGQDATAVIMELRMRTEP